MNIQSDSPLRYGTITRFIHWLMALLFLALFSTAIGMFFSEGQTWFQLLNWHKTIGFFLMLSIILRLIWTVINLGKRPAHLSLAAHLGHLALYALMFLVPFIGLLRQYGAARGSLEIFGFTVLPKAAEPIEWMSTLGNNFHSKLGWLLLVLIIGHIAMVIVHRIKGDDVLPRMLGKTKN